MLLFRGGRCASITVNTIDGHHVPSGFGHHAEPARARAAIQYFGLAVGPRQG